MARWLSRVAKTQVAISGGSARAIRTETLRAQRRCERQYISLTGSLIKPYTATLYTAACRWFFDTIELLGEPVPDEIVDFDALVQRTIELAWHEGESRALMGNLSSGLEHKVSGLRS